MTSHTTHSHSTGDGEASHPTPCVGGTGKQPGVGIGSQVTRRRMAAAKASTPASASGCFPPKPQGLGGPEMLSWPLTVIGLVWCSFAKEGGGGAVRKEPAEGEVLLVDRTGV